MTSIRSSFDLVLAGKSLDASAAQQVIGEILDGDLPETLIAGFLIALRIKGESASEIEGAARAMRAHMRRVYLDAPDLIDVVGTGGDGSGTFNISTGAALIAAAAGVPVAKHGNKAITGRVGAADVMEQMGVRLDLDPTGLARSIKAARFCFIFAPEYHPVLARLGSLRRNLGVRTVFNVLGPLCNPALPSRMLLGVGDARLFHPIAEALAGLGTVHALVVQGRDGMDEISLTSPTLVAEVRGEVPIREYEISPDDFGFTPARSVDLSARDPRAAGEILQRALAGGTGPEQSILALNAGAAIYVGGHAGSISEGVVLAREVIASGRALKTLDLLVKSSRETML